MTEYDGAGGEHDAFTRLSRIAVGERARLVSIRAGVGLRGRLTAMGLVPGVELKVVQNAFWGPVIVEVKGTRVVLGHGMARRVEVASAS